MDGLGALFRPTCWRFDSRACRLRRNDDDPSLRPRPLRVGQRHGTARPQRLRPLLALEPAPRQRHSSSVSRSTGPRLGPWRSGGRVAGVLLSQEFLPEARSVPAPPRAPVRGSTPEARVGSGPSPGGRPGAGVRVRVQPAQGVLLSAGHLHVRRPPVCPQSQQALPRRPRLDRTYRLIPLQPHGTDHSGMPPVWPAKFPTEQLGMCRTGRLPPRELDRVRHIREAQPTDEGLKAHVRPVKGCPGRTRARDLRRTPRTARWGGVPGRRR